MSSTKSIMVNAENALPGRSTAINITNRHFVNGASLQPPFEAGTETAVFGMGCFWGAERLFWELEGVISTAVGYAGGLTDNPTYEEICSGQTGHAEVVLVVFDPTQISYARLLQVFFESHNPTQGMRQGNDLGTQYRSVIQYGGTEQQELAQTAMDAYQRELNSASLATITTILEPVTTFYYAEDYHQQYLAKNPNGYCGIGGTGVTCPIPQRAATSSS
ncbi:MAG: peptide-methionine (S)-S-oxide reductase MsrA [Gammaproteobacteria bacterium]